MKAAIEKFIRYLRYERNASPNTLRSYQSDLEQFQDYLNPPRDPGEARRATSMALAEVDHPLIREFIGHLHDRHLERSSIARKLAALRSFFNFCVREGLLAQNPARLVATPKLPKRVPSVLSAEEINAFLDQLARMESRGIPAESTSERGRAAKGTTPRRQPRAPNKGDEEARLL